MSKLVQIQYDTNCYDSYESQTCLNLFRFNMIQIVTIHMILKHVDTCSYLDTCRENKGEWFGMMYLLGAIRRL